MGRTQSNTPKNLSIIIIHYKVKKNLYSCIDSLLKNKPRCSFEIIVVDNDEKQKIKKELLSKYTHIKYIKSHGNIGYGSAINLGAKYSVGKILYILNTDTKILPNSTSYLIKNLEKNIKLGIVAPSLVNSAGFEYSQLGSSTLTPLKGIFALSFLNKIFPNNPISKSYFVRPKSKINPYEVDVVPGSAFMVRRDVFEKVGGFDENFFLYFEESDFCKRVKAFGWKIFIVPQAKIIHQWKGSTSQTNKIKKIFAQSRFYYFKKHFGILNAILVEFFANFSKWDAILVLILFWGTILRFYRIQENLVFDGELGDNYLATKNLILSNRIPLTSPLTPHPWVSFDSLFYLIFAPILFFSNFNPVLGEYFFAIIGVVLILVNYIVIKKIFDSETACLSSYLIALSPAFLELAKESSFFSLTIITFYLFLYFLVKLTEDPKYLFWASLFLGISLNFNPTQLFFVPLMVLIPLKFRKKIKGNDFIKISIGLLIPNIPFLLYNLKNRFEMVTKLATWIPYRVIVKANANILSKNLLAVYNFIQKTFLPSSGRVAIIFVVSFLIFLIYLTKKYIFSKNIAFYALLVWFYLGILAIFIQGYLSSHYYFPSLYSVPVIITSYMLKKISSSKIGSLILFIFLSVFTIININYFFSKKWFFLEKTKMPETKLVPYRMQLDTANLILKGANGSKLILRLF
jgi:hypothetical protein